MRKKKENPEDKLERLFGAEETEEAVSNEVSAVDFELQSPLLMEEVIERKNEISLEAIEDPVSMELNSKPSFSSFGMPTFTVAPPKEEEAKVEGKVILDEEIVYLKEEPKVRDDLPRMSVENQEGPSDPISLGDIQKKAGQTTAKWSWTLFENAGPKLQLFLSELNESELRKLVIEDLLPPDSIDFAKDYNKSLEDEFEIKDWEKELIYPPFEELLEQAGMNTSMSPGARLAVGMSVVLGTRAIQTKKYREEREELIQRLMNSYSKSKESPGPANNPKE